MFMLNIDSMNKHQRMFGIIMFCIVVFILCANLIYYYSFDPDGIDGNFFNPNIIMMLILLPIITVTVLWRNKVTRIGQCFLLYGVGAVAIYGNLDSFWGWGMFILSIIMAFDYGFLTKHTILKTYIALLFLVCLGCIGQWWGRGLAFGKSIYSFIVILFFILLGWAIKLVFEPIRDEITQLEEIIEKQNAVILKLTEEPSSSFQKCAPYDQDGNLANLTSKEKQLLEVFYKSEGSFTNKEIAEDLGMNEASVKAAFHRIMKKLDVASRAQLLIKYEGK